MANTTSRSRVLKDWIRKYPLAPRYRRAELLWVVGGQGVRLRVARVVGPASARCTVVLLHGFLNSSRTPRVYAFARLLANHADVLVPDLRGHGRSGGRCTLARPDPDDIAAVVGLARPDAPVITVGASLGAATALMHAAERGGVDAVVSVSATGWWGEADRAGALRLRRFVVAPGGRWAAAALLRTRVAPWEPGLLAPIDVVDRIAPATTVLVHDPDDEFFGAEHAEALHARARSPKELWWVPGAGHGVDLLTEELAARVLGDVLPAASRSARG
jgi:pimeloyl-ACP methyl ester carboxylesterase